MSTKRNVTFLSRTVGGSIFFLNEIFITKMLFTFMLRDYDTNNRRGIGVDLYLHNDIIKIEED